MAANYSVPTPEQAEFIKLHGLNPEQITIIHDDGCTLRFRINKTGQDYYLRW